MTYHRIEEPQDLPPPGPPTARSREKSDLDFKRFADRSQMSEHAKDIAAFANALGGVLLIGADDNSGQLLYPGVLGQTVAEVKAIFEGAAKMCSPTVVVDVVPVERSPGVPVVAVNVDPYVDQAVAAPAASGSPAWVFPIRRASQTEYITPEALPLYMNREIRRAVLMLSKIPLDARREVAVHYHTRKPVQGGVLETHVESLTMTVEHVSVERNRVRLIGQASWSPQCNIPLLDVLDVWESRDGKWDVRVAGEIQRVKDGCQFGDTLSYAPLPR